MALPFILLGGGLALAGTFSFFHNRILIAEESKNLRHVDNIAAPNDPLQSTFEQTQQDLQQRETRANRDLKISFFAMGASGIGSVAFPPLLFVAIPLTLYGSLSIFKDTLEGWREKRNIRSSAVDTVAILGTLAAQYYFAAAFINGMYFVGQKLLLKTEDSSNKDMLNLFGNHPRSVWLWIDGVEIEVPFEQVRIGQIVVTHAGETIPFDGEVVKGEITVDQHMLTGESKPQDKSYRDSVFANTLLVGGNAHIKVLKTGKDTVSAQIGEVLQNTVDFNTTIDTRGTNVVNKMTFPTLLAGLVALRTVGLRGAVAVVNCNFSDIARITVPLGVLSHLRQVSEQGILVKDGRALEQLAQVDTVVFDKTGTLTCFEPSVSKIYTMDNRKEDEVLALAVCAEHRQAHPVARAIQKLGKQRNLSIATLEQVDYEIGYGIHAQIQGQSVLLGSERLMSRDNIALPASGGWHKKETNEIHSLVYMAIEGKLAGVIELKTPIRSEVPALLKALHKRGLKLCILSGDHELPTRNLAQSLGIDEYVAETLPKDKGKHIEKMQAQGRTVCFIGDGINDTIAMKKAEVSISISGASTVATDTANILFLNKSLSQLDTLFASANKFERKIKSNLGWALIPGIAGMGAVFLFRMSIYGAVGLYALSLSIGATNTAVPLLRQHLKLKKNRDKDKVGLKPLTRH